MHKIVLNYRNNFYNYFYNSSGDSTTRTQVRSLCSSVKTLGKFFHSTLLQFTQLYKWVSGYRQWWICVRAAVVHRDGVWVNRSVREVKYKVLSPLNCPEDWLLRYIQTWLFTKGLPDLLLWFFSCLPKNGDGSSGLSIICLWLGKMLFPPFVGSEWVTFQNCCRTVIISIRGGVHPDLKPLLTALISCESV